MKTPCYTDNVNKYQNTTSCSMILRSSCSHGQAPKFLAGNGMKTKCNHQERKSLLESACDHKRSVCETPKSSLQLQSLFESSLKQLAFKSSRTFAVLKEKLCNQAEFSEVHSAKSVDCVTSKTILSTAASDSSLFLPAISSNIQQFSEDAITVESDYSSFAMMSRTRNLGRNNLRAFSGSESEDDPPLLARRATNRRTAAANSTNHQNSSVRNYTNATTNHTGDTSQRNASHAGTTPTGFSHSTPHGHLIPSQSSMSPESPLLDKSTVQDSMRDKFRWFIWRYVYLKIVQCINFDVWLLSRLRRSNKMLLIFLPLLLFLFYVVLSGNTGALSSTFDLISSSIVTVMSSIHSFNDEASEPSESVPNQDPVIDSTCHALPSIISYLSGIISYLSGIISYLLSYFHTVDSKSFSTSDLPPPHVYTKSQPHAFYREEFKSLAIEVFEERLNALNEHTRNTQNSQISKDDVASLQKEISVLREQLKSSSDVARRLEKDVHMMENSRFTSAKTFEELFAEHKYSLMLLNTKMNGFEEKLNSFAALKSCCDEKWKPVEIISTIEKHLIAAFKSVMTGDKKSPYHFFNDHLNSKFVDEEKLSAGIRVAVDRMKKELSSDVSLDVKSTKLIEEVVKLYLKAQPTTGSSGSYVTGSVSDETVKKIVREAILLYDADKTGKVDYALESGGGSVLGTRCSESYVEKNGKFSVFGFPLWSDQNSPRTAIQPSVQPGQCWAFKGSQGFLVIQLSYTIAPTGFTLEHVPLSLSPSGSIDSAPKDFSVWGLTSDSDNEGTLLGHYSYNQNGEPLQYFPVQYITPAPFSYVELKIHSNQGNLEYTCLYRFRVHGTRA